MEPFNYVETKTIPVCKQISYNSFKNQITYKLVTYKSFMYTYLNVCKQMTDVKLFLLHSNTWNHLTVYQKKKTKKKRVKPRLKMLSTKCVDKSYVFNIYV